MSTYKDYVLYFENIATKNLAINHSVPGKKKFFRMGVEELYSGAAGELPSADQGPFLIFINYISDLEYRSTPTDLKDMMLVVGMGCSDNDFDHETEARDKCERVCQEIVRRLVRDSLEGHELLNHSLDKPDKIRTVPFELQANNRYVCFQMSFGIRDDFDPCYDESKWLPE